MGTSQKEIASWVHKAKRNKKNTHLVVVCDTFSYEDYPVAVTEKESIQDVIKKYDGPEMQKIMEIYSMKMDIQPQLDEQRAWHPDHK